MLLSNVYHKSNFLQQESAKTILQSQISQPHINQIVIRWAEFHDQIIKLFVILWIHPSIPSYLQDTQWINLNYQLLLLVLIFLNTHKCATENIFCFLFQV